MAELHVATVPEKKPVPKPKVTWNAAQDDTLITTLEEQKKLGLQSESGWKGTVWTTVAGVINKEHSSDVPKGSDQCKSRFGRLKEEYKVVKELLGTSGFGWDEGKGVVTAEETVWAPLIKANPTYEKWKTKSFPLYYQLAELIGDVIATGENVYRSASFSTSSRSSAVLEDAKVDREASGDESDEVEAIDNAALKKQYRAATPEDPKKCRKGHTSGAHAIERMVDVVDGLTRALLAPEDKIPTALPPSPTRRKQAYQLAEDEEGLSDNEMVGVMKLFARDTAAADAYLAFKRPTARTLWLRDALDNPPV
ncbi:hypothetical protein M422DRAFT_264574 [Sphaerobolus stellatus SS14]|uniref:Myb/SANT-like domain-containing protein n=1 Tax=Sphaerobolus stellatus (strain SS14) TaxID=990650 RepID=A0A0C9UFE0_SPHS4|nr:hypothetical protein M422DRAFT_264574 [Sphaerobolus stellatus SS14]